MSDFTDSLEKILLGAPRGIVLTPADRERTAYHESGHALVGMLTAGADPVRKISIIPRGMALGVTLSTPENDRVSITLEELQAKIKVALGGRVAEEVVYGTFTTGAESDIQQLTLIARQMVGRWGMSDAVGPVAVLPQDGSGPFLPGRQRNLRAHPAAGRRRGAASWSKRAHQEVTELLGEHREQLESLARALLERGDARRARRLPRGRRAAAGRDARAGSRLKLRRPGPPAAAARAPPRALRLALPSSSTPTRADRQADQRRGHDRRRDHRRDQVLGEAQRGDRGGHAELGGRGQPGRHRSARSPRRRAGG